MDIDAVELSGAINSLREGIQVLSPQWRYLYVNEAAAKHGRRRPEELRGRTMLECYPGIEKTEVFAVLDGCMRARQARNLETEFEYADGQRAWFELRVQPCPEGLIVLSLDVTERKQLETSLRQGEKLRALGQMAASVAHDLKNILNPIALGVQRLRRDFRKPVDRDEVLDAIDHAVRTGAETVEQLRRFSRQENDRPPELADLNRIVDAALAICLPRIRELAGVEVRREHGEPPPVLVHPSELVSAVVNLVVNALDALPAKGMITLRTGGADGGAWVEVADTGPGMPPEVERRLFEPFFTTKPSGTGLGLAMVYNLVQRHAGRVHLTTAPGRGTTLRLWFPPGHNVTPTTTRSAPAASAPAPGVVASTRGRLLVVEDEPAARRALRSLLEDEGFTVETAATGEDALPLLRAFQPQALVLDLHLPGIDGTTVAREARARNPSLPVIFMSGSPELGDAVAPSFDGPPAEHVGKPVDLDRLLAVLDRALAL